MPLLSLLRWLSPGWRVSIAALVFIGWRWAAVGARAAEIVTTAQRDDFIAACAGDFALVWALGLLWRTAACAKQSWSAALIGYGEALAVACGLIGVASIVVRAGDYVHCYLARCHLSAEAALYLGGGFGDAAWTTQWLVVALTAIASAVIVVTLLSQDAVTHADDHATGDRALQRFGAPVGFGLAALLAAVALAQAAAEPPNEFGLRIVPEANFVYQLQVLAEDTATRPNTLPPIAADRWRRWQRWGFVPSASRQNEPFPLFQPHLQEPPLALPRKRGVVTQPNVVLIILESTSTLFVSELSGYYRGLMPELSALARKMTRVQPYYNTSSPTIAGTIATLCSVFPPTHPADVRAMANSNESTSFSCLSDILRTQNYRSYYVAGHDPRQANMEEFLRHHGFDEVHTEPQLAAHFGKVHKSWFGFHDAEVYTYAMAQIERLEAARLEDNRPYLMVIATLDAHEPGLAPPGFELPVDATLAVEGAPKDKAARQLLAGYHFADKALGPFGCFLLEDKRAAETLFAITADHAPFRTTANESVYTNKPYSWSYAPLPLLLHDPAHELPKVVEVLSGSLDVAPSILQLLGVVDVPNSLTGHSVFGTRPLLPTLLGRTGSRGIWLITPSDNREAPMAEIQEACRIGAPLLRRDKAAPGTCDLLALLQWQDAVWAAKRLRPQLPTGQ